MNVFRDPLPSRYQLLLCRNLALTYLGPARQGKMLRRFVIALEPGGFL
jgi:chemotaxis methyl-accepting protein methylase